LAAAPRPHPVTPTTAETSVGTADHAAAATGSPADGAAPTEFGGRTVAEDSQAVITRMSAPPPGRACPADGSPDRSAVTPRRGDPPMTSATAPGRSLRAGSGPGPMLLPARPEEQNAVVKLFMVIPFLAVGARAPLRLGMGSELVRHRPGGVLVLVHPRRHHCRVPPLLHPPLVQSQQLVAGGTGRGWGAARAVSTGTVRR